MLINIPEDKWEDIIELRGMLKLLIDDSDLREETKPVVEGYYLFLKGLSKWEVNET